MASPRPGTGIPASPEHEAPQKDRAPHDDAPPQDASPLWKVALRDAAIAAAALSLFAAADAWSALAPSALATGLSVVDGLLVGAGVAALVHEWGHLAGARLAGGRAPLAPFRDFLPLFAFDYQRNDRAAFLGMSVGGNLAHWLVFLVLWTSLSFATAGQVALASAAFGFCVFASSIELPVIRRAQQGASALEALGGIRRDFLRVNGGYGVAAAALAALVL